MSTTTVNRIAKHQADCEGNGCGDEVDDAPRSAAIAANGIRTAGNFAELMSALMSDLIEGKITPSVGNAAVNAGGKLLKITEMQLKFGTTSKIKQPRDINLLPQSVAK